ncbi:hypothetical protein F4556_003967 [Kitasatospora gansuensis]|uniref:Small hydrophobic protein n=1 Tax=Kitasatospora gansuensis TaxID=258050 RepID=A0A7W7WI46_9ACTN|nr:DUF6126 family protein [Kitasatospora gansuensis]MBB4948432.1 hypothetical protein [Kitasatospora gansuensis]
MTEAVRSDAGTGAVRSSAVRDEKSRRRQMLVRASIYIAGTHLFAGFVILLFALGNRH